MRWTADASCCCQDVCSENVWPENYSKVRNSAAKRLSARQPIDYLITRLALNLLPFLSLSHSIFLQRLPNSQHHYWVDNTANLLFNKSFLTAPKLPYVTYNRIYQNWHISSCFRKRFVCVRLILLRRLERYYIFFSSLGNLQISFFRHSILILFKHFQFVSLPHLMWRAMRLYRIFFIFGYLFHLFLIFCYCRKLFLDFRWKKWLCL